MRTVRILIRTALWLTVILVPGSALRGDEPHPADLIKVGLMAFFFVLIANHILRATGLAAYTTKGQ